MFRAVETFRTLARIPHKVIDKVIDFDRRLSAVERVPVAVKIDAPGASAREDDEDEDDDTDVQVKAVAAMAVEHSRLRSRYLAALEAALYTLTKEERPEIDAEKRVARAVEVVENALDPMLEWHRRHLVNKPVRYVTGSNVTGCNMVRKVTLELTDEGPMYIAHYDDGTDDAEKVTPIL